MVSPLQFKQKDPNNKGRGAGFYYRRSGNTFSKYSKERDYDKGKKTGGSRRYAHATDTIKEAGEQIPKEKRRFLSEKRSKDKSARFLTTENKSTKKKNKFKK